MASGVRGNGVVLRRRVEDPATAPENGSPGPDVDVPCPSPSPTTDLPVTAYLLLMALAMACVGAGFWSRGQLALAVTLALAGVTGARRLARSIALPAHRPLVAAVVALAAWATVRAAAAGAAAAAAGIVSLLAAMVVAVAIVAALAPAERSVVIRAFVGLGSAVALSAIGGVAFHIELLATRDPHLWRAAATLTYPNATAALLVMTLLVAAGQLLAAPGDRLVIAAVTVTAAGLVSTLSRGGALGLVAGAAVLVLLARPGWRLRALVAPVMGSIVVLAGLVPSMGVGGMARPVLGLMALIAGVGLAMVAGPMVGGTGPAARRATPPAAKPAVAVALAVAIGGVAALAALAPLAAPAPGLDGALAGRLSFASADRAEGLRAALDEIVERPLFGRGPGDSSVRWTRTGAGGTETVSTLRFVHDEYVQVVVELGLVGAVLLGAVLGAVARIVGRARAIAVPPELRAGIAAALVALAVHSSLDFLWHLPVLPLSAAVLLGTVAPPSAQGES